MNDQERLEEIKENLLPAIEYGYKFSSLDIGQVFADINYIIQQAEEKQELEKENSDLSENISAFEQLWLEEKEKRKRYEKIIHNIANIDAMFFNPDGTEKEWNDKEALKEIEKMVKPIWEEHCKTSWERHTKS